VAAHSDADFGEQCPDRKKGWTSVLLPLMGVWYTLGALYTHRQQRSTSSLGIKVTLNK